MGSNAAFRGIGLGLWVMALTFIGCASLPKGRSAVDAVGFEGTSKADDGDLEEKIATRPSSRFFGIWDGVVYDYEIYERFKLERDLERIQRFYRARGFYEARVRAARVEERRPRHVRVLIRVEEGPEVRIGSKSLSGLESVPKKVAKLAREALDRTMPVGRRFDEDEFTLAEAEIKRALTDNGFAYANVERRADVDLPRHVAHVHFVVAAGDPVVWGETKIYGLEGLPEAPVRRALDLKSGEPYSTAKLEAAQQAVLDLGVFSAADIDPLPQPPPRSHVVPLLVRLSPTKLRTLKLGGGIELDTIRTDLHLQASWQDRNFLGGLREFEVQFKPGIVLYPTTVPRFHAPTDVLPEERLSARLRQPGFLEARTSGLIRGEFNIYPLLLTPQKDPTGNVIGYREVRGATGVERRFGKFYVSPTYNIQANFPFAYIGEKQDIPNVVISYLDLITYFDFRNDRIHPHKGLYIGNELQLAGSVLGGDATDIRVQPELRAYVPLGHKVTLALRGSVGFLFPSNYGNTRDVTGNYTKQDFNRDTELIFFRGFFSGGPSSNRGYPLRGVGPHGTIPFLLDPALQQSALGCTAESTDARCSQPLGGFSLWETSAELRFAIGGPVSAATFCDAGDVAPDTLQLRPQRLHLSCGAGIRYDTPVGPIRLDIGYRIPGLQTLDRPDPRSEGNPGTILGLPIAIAFGIGEAY